MIIPYFETMTIRMLSRTYLLISMYLSGGSASVVGDPAVEELLASVGGAGGDRAWGHLAVCAELPREHRWH